MPAARKIHIQGHVQGVFFREWTVQTASQLSLTGWVRNRADGSVEVLAVGEPALLDMFIQQLRNGSPASRVDSVDIEEAEPEPLESFSRRSSV